MGSIHPAVQLQGANSVARRTVELALDVATLRALFRNLQAFRACYEDEGIDAIIDPDGIEWSIHDLEYLYEQLPLLPARQHQAIELCFVQNMKESEAATTMGVSYTNPVSIYANNGLTKLIMMIHAGRFDRFKPAEYVLPQTLVDVRIAVEIDVRVQERSPECPRSVAESTGH